MQKCLLVCFVNLCGFEKASQQIRSRLTDGLAHSRKMEHNRFKLFVPRLVRNLTRSGLYLCVTMVIRDTRPSKV